MHFLSILSGGLWTLSFNTFKPFLIPFLVMPFASQLPLFVFFQQVLVLKREFLSIFFAFLELCFKDSYLTWFTVSLILICCKSI